MNKWLKQVRGHWLVLLILCVLSQYAVADSASADSSGSASPDILFQDMKTFLGATNAANIEAAKILLYMLPPFYDITLAVSSRINSGEDAKQDWQEKQLRRFAEYNVMTKKRSAQELLGERVGFCLDDKGKPAKFCNYENPASGDDVLASALLDTLAYANGGERLAALQYIKNITNYAPLPYPGDNVVFQDKDHKEKGLTPDGIEYFAKAYKEQAMLTMAQNALLDIFADRTRFDNFSKGLPVGKNGNASILEMLYYEVERRYMNQNWYDQMNKSSDSAMLREIANMLALQNYLQLKQYTQAAHIQAMMAASLSASNQMTVQTDSQPKVDTKKMMEQGNL